jgi:hypothetical protein
MAYNVNIRRDAAADELFDIIRDLAPDLLSSETADIPIEFHVERPQPPYFCRK